MNAKLGGIPWSISDMPLSDQPTQVIGYSSCKKGHSNIFAVCASLNRTFNQYFSDAMKQGEENLN